MSYNIDHVEANVLDAWMTAKDVIELSDEWDGEGAECTFLEGMVKPAKKALVRGEPDARIPLPNIWWYGEGSGRGFEDVFVKHLAPKIMGKVEAVCTWEGGDSTTAFAITDGVFEECEVEIKVKRKKRAR